MRPVNRVAAVGLEAGTVSTISFLLMAAFCGIADCP